MPRAGRAAVPREGLNALAQYSEQAPPAIDDYATRADMAYDLSKINALVTSPATAGTTLSQMTTLLGLCNYGGLIDPLFTDVEGVA